MHVRYYGTTTYNQAHQNLKTKTKESKNRKPCVRFKIYIRTCKLCGLKINPEPKTAKEKKEIKSQDSKRIASRLYWPPGEKNIKDSQINYPKLKLPKYCLRPQVIENIEELREANEEEFCSCQGHVPVMVNAILVTRSNEKFVKKEQKIKRKKTPAVVTGTSEDTKTSEMIATRFERGTKTDARHRFLKKYQEIIPNLNDAVQTGKKHNFFGWNVNFFRG